MVKRSAKGTRIHSKAEAGSLARRLDDLRAEMAEMRGRITSAANENARLDRNRVSPENRKDRTRTSLLTRAGVGRRASTQPTRATTNDQQPRASQPHATTQDQMSEMESEGQGQTQGRSPGSKIGKRKPRG